MNRKILYTILGGLLMLSLVFLMWYWFFHRTSTPSNTGSLGSSQDRGKNSGVGTSTSGNGEVPLENSVDIGTDSVVVSSDQDYSGGVYYLDPVLYSSSTAYTLIGSGVIWLDGSLQNGGTFKSFNPTPINSVSGGSISGLPRLGGSGTGGNGGTGLGSALLGAGITGSVACTAGFFSGAASGALASLGLSALAVTVNAPAQNVSDASDAMRENFLNCIARGIARAAIAQITASTVDWINSGFNGSPAFIQNYEQFFTNVADQAAGQFIQGSGLAFLCSPFQLQVKIAIAQSYAHRRGGGAGQSCTLNKVINNVEGFMNGDFSQGGWPGLISFTTMPTNNPYGAYMYGEIALVNAQNKAVSLAQAKISPGGFLSSEKCDPPAYPGGPAQNCKITTPGSSIQASLEKTLGTSLDSLNLADSFDEIISALVSQLMTKVLYSGLSTLSGQNGYASNSGSNSVASAAAQTLLTNLQNAVQVAQQYGIAQQGSIGDIQNAQSQITNVENCWRLVASSTTLTAGQTVQASDNANAAAALTLSLESRVGAFNNNITRANAAIVRVQQLQTSALAATNLSQVQAVASQLTSAQNSGQLIVQSDVVSAQQNRTTLQAEMQSLNQTTAQQLNQCYAFGQ